MMFNDSITILQKLNHNFAIVKSPFAIQWLNHHFAMVKPPVLQSLKHHFAMVTSPFCNGYRQDTTSDLDKAGPGTWPQVPLCWGLLWRINGDVYIYRYI